MQQGNKALGSIFQKDIERGIKNDKMSTIERAGQLIALPFIIAVIVFLYAHYERDTGFFTSAFGPLEAFLFYIPVVVGFIPLFIRVVYGRRNQARLFDIANDVFIIIAAAWLLGRWPFDFSHFSEPLPFGLDASLNWVSDGMMQLLAMLLIPLLLFVIIHESMVYVGVKEGLVTGPSVEPAPIDEAKPEPPTQTPAPEEKKP